MSDSPVRNLAPEPVPDYAALVVLRWDHEGIYHCCYGPGLARVGMTDGELVGKRLQDVWSTESDLLRACDQLAQGHPVQEWVRVGGVRWWLDARPDLDPETGALRWVDGVCYPERVECRLQVHKPAPRTRVIELAGALDSEPGYWSGDRFVWVEGRPGITLTRYLPLGELRRLECMYPDRMHAIRDSRPAADPPRPNLRVL